MCARPTWQCAIRLAENNNNNNKSQQTNDCTRFNQIEPGTNLEGSLLLSYGGEHAFKCCHFHTKGAKTMAQTKPEEVQQRVSPQTVRIITLFVSYMF